MKPFLMLLTLLGLIAAATIGAAQGPATGSISGRVIDMDTGLPLAGVKVGRSAQGYAVTDSEGRYVLANLPAGPMVVFAQEANGGYTNISLTGPKRVTVVAGKDVSGIDFRGRFDGQISGRVRDANGEPLPGVRVSVVEQIYERSEREYGKGELVARISASALTDDRGGYRIENSIFAGRKYWILAQRQNRYGTPLSDAPADPQSRRQVLVPTYYPGAPDLTTALPVTVGSFEHRTNVDIRMLTAQQYCLEATLRAAGAPAPLRFAVEGETVPSEGLGPGGVPRQGGVAGPDGRIRVCDLYPGRFQLIASSGGTVSALPEYFGSVFVTINRSDVTGIDLTALLPVAVAGEFVWANSPADPSFKPPVGIALSPRHVLTGPIMTPATIPGEFSLTTLPMLRYGLMVSLPQALYVQDITYDGVSAMHRPFVPGAGKLRLVVGHDAGTLTARVGDANGQPSAGTAVIVLPAIAQSEVELAAAMVAGTTDENGLFTAPNLPPGRYYALATNDPPPSRVLLPSGRLQIDKIPDTIALLMRTRSRAQLVQIGPNASASVMLSPGRIGN